MSNEDFIKLILGCMTVVNANTCRSQFDYQVYAFYLTPIYKCTLCVHVFCDFSQNGQQVDLLSTHITSVLSRLRTATRFTRPVSRTKEYCSFIDLALNHYQVPPRNK